MNAHTLGTSTTAGHTAALDTASARWLTALDRLERTTVADPAIGFLQRGIRSLPLGGMRDLLRGRPLGHPVHPVLVQVPIGCWLSAAVLDVVPGARHAATTLTAVGLAGVAPAAVAGWADWADLPPEQARVGLAHAVSNVAAVACYTVSLTARLRGRAAKGMLWSWGGLTAVAVSGALGGHVAYRQAVGPHDAT
ncbi:MULTISPECIES: DUF2231 domain-containing protein [unclassified Streptomyces]|uniref:DUF2231 domain-containing protein n=1 Tax=unclassified Streptomyces TaxID=2593676 RepID=UPI002258F572|nr:MULTISPECIES: DUF2231 domain-containing protein [unclassified Streptomyces]MCX5152084.1 hypothetical protein [Streptomyces sp. NBC_00320]WSN46489.1 hypothetical protein OG299_01575 [Streptomyces sp. NBC_01296]